VDAGMAGAISAVIVGALSVAGAMYGSRGANRAAREASAVTGYDSLTQRLVAERDKAEMDEKAAEARASAAEARASALESENHRLRELVVRLGGAP
jgi:outer membrane murein-binding lipoprotein Lpp